MAYSIVTIFEKTNWLVRKSIILYVQNSCWSMKTLMEIKGKKCILIEDEVSGWLQIWMTVSSLNITHNFDLPFILDMIHSFIVIS